MGKKKTIMEEVTLQPSQEVIPSTMTMSRRIVRRTAIKKETPPSDTRCMARITHDHSAQHFGNGHNKFYLEFRCSLPRFRDGPVCVRCLEKKSTGAQDSRTFQHGLVNEPIPAKSHIFGGQWYKMRVEKWGEPEPAIIQFAYEHRQEARGAYDVTDPEEESSKASDPSSFQDEMPPRKKKDQAVLSEVPSPAEEKPKRARRTKKEMTEEDEKKEETEPKAPKAPKKRIVRKKAEPTPYQALASDQRLIYKELTLPTHMEQSIEELDVEDYEVKYVTLTSLEISGVLYYIDKDSQKVFKRIRDKQVGAYMGKYDPQTESLHTDVPDSDDEQEEDTEDQDDE